MKKQFKYGRTVITVIAVALLFLLAFLIIDSVWKERQDKYAPDITGVMADEKTLYSVSDNLNKTGTLLIFFDLETDKAIQLMQLISTVAPDYSADVIAVSLDKRTIPEQLALLKDLKITAFDHMLFDLDGEMAKTYQVSDTPITYFIDKTGRINDAYIASISEKSLRKELAALD